MCAWPAARSIFDAPLRPCYGPLFLSRAKRAPPKAARASRAQEKGDHNMGAMLPICCMSYVREANELPNAVRPCYGRAALPCAHGPSRAASSMLLYVREANERTTGWITKLWWPRAKGSGQSNEQLQIARRRLACRAQRGPLGVLPQRETSELTLTRALRARPPEVPEIYLAALQPRAQRA